MMNNSWPFRYPVLPDKFLKDNTIFADAGIGEYGQLVDKALRTLLQDIDVFINGMLNFSDIKRLSIEFGYCISLNLWAGADQKLNMHGYAIALNIGSPWQLMDTFTRLLSHPKVLPDIGQIPKSIPESLALVRYSDDGSTSYGSGATKTSKNFSDSNLERASCIRQLTLFGMQFLFFHELAHITGHHIEYKKMLPWPSLAEMRAMEHLADARAITYAGGYQQLCIPATMKQFGMTLETDAVAKLFRLWAFAMGITFRLFEVFYGEHSGGASSSYPSAIMRSNIVNATALSQTDLYALPSLQGAIKDAFKRGMNEAKDAWLTMNWPQAPEPSESQYKNTFDSVVSLNEKLDDMFGQSSPS